MKYLFATIFALLVLASVVTQAYLPDHRSGVPLIYWVTDANPARIDQIRLFHLWQIKNGHYDTHDMASASDARKYLERLSPPLRGAVVESQPALGKILATDSDEVPGVSFPITLRTPKGEARVDSANSDQTKRIIQGVSGVGGDVMDMWSGGGMRFFDSMALIMDVTDDARRMGFGLDQTYPALATELTLPTANGLRQFQFPCNVVASMYIVNKEAFERFGQPLPPTRWTLDEFETRGKAYVSAANKPGERRKFFFAEGVPPDQLRRSIGVSEFNETGTLCRLDDERNARLYERVKKWTEVDRILPSGSDRESFATDSGYGGAGTQLFNNGNYAMVFTGRYMLIQYRKFNIERVRQGRSPMQLTVVEAPHGGFPNTNMGTRAAAVYAGSPHPEIAKLFLAFLASEDYNMQIVRDADSLPPNPKYTLVQEYLHPATDPAQGIYPETEDELHKPFADVALTIALGSSYSPFVLQATVQRIEDRHRQAFTNNQKTADQAARAIAREVNDEILRTANESPKLRAEYDRLLGVQKQIDTLRAAGQKVPLSMITDPFHRAYYQHMGWAEVAQ